MGKSHGELLILTTLDDPEKAAAFARGLVDAHLAACVTVLPSARTFYRWNGDEIRDDQEWVLLIKSHRDKLTDLERYFQNAHPYECPEFLALDIAELSPAYQNWLRKELQLDSTNSPQP